MKKIVNPYAKAESEDYQCFGCSPQNISGLRMEFFLDGDEVVSFWSPRKWAQGYVNVLHGGIQATLLDEIASWVVQSLVGTVGVTTSMEINYRKAVFIDAGRIELRAVLKEKTSRVATIETRLLNAAGELCTTAAVKYYMLPESKAIADFHYPGQAAFFE